ncbi:MAG: CAP domain-containing protein [Actinomycetes bacterium]|jgi:uncharacterized protein YkwD|nr:CAP domain-containing protein [Actinomycetes bacterium]
MYTDDEHIDMHPLSDEEIEQLLVEWGNEEAAGTHSSESTMTPYKRAMLRAGAVLLALLLLLPIIGSLSSLNPPAGPATAQAAVDTQVPISGTLDYAAAWQVLVLTNAERAKEGLAPLTMDAQLVETAMVRARECLLVFDHTRPDGTPCYTAFPANYTTGAVAAENIGAGYPTAAAMVRGWMNSPGHRANIMNPALTTIGIGVFHQDGAGYGWAQDFSNAAPVGATRPANVSGIYDIAVDTTKFPLRYDIGWAGDIRATRRTVAAGSHMQLTVICQRADIDEIFLYVQIPAERMRWTASNAAVATVDAGERLTARSPGQTTFTAWVDNKKIASTPTLTVKPAKGVVAAVKRGKKTLRVRWKKQTGVSGYQIRYRRRGQSKWTTKRVGAARTTLTLRKLRRRTGYQVQVRAYATIAGSRVYGSYSSTKTVKTK